MKITYWLIPLLLLILIAPFSAFLDLGIENYFYQSNGGKFYSGGSVQTLFVWGILPGWLLAIAGLGLLFVKNSATKRIGLYLVLCLAIGSGLITHLALKDQWGRPRPRQIEQFDGSATFRPFYSPNFSATEPYKSFPSGHATMGFYFFSLGFVGYHLKKRWLFVIGISLALILGSLLGLGRMMQGGHFFSDVLISGLLMWLTAALLSKYLLKYERIDG